MCHFEYKKFDSCGDYGIEICQVCDEALWRGGLRGALQICVPRILERSLEWSGLDEREPPKPALFRGYDGFCEMCVTKFKLPYFMLQRSYSDHELDYSRSWNSFNPDNPAPYLSFGGIIAQIPELLGLSDQFEAARLKQGPYMIFSRSLEQCTWSQLRRALPFTYPGEFQSDFTLDLDETMKRLNIKAGITEYDRDRVVYALQHGPHPRLVYKNLFKARGMPLGHFNINIVKICQQIVSEIQAQKAADAEKSVQQHRDNSDDSTLTTLTNTPILSDMDIPLVRPESRGSDCSDNLRLDGSTSTSHRSRKRQALQTTMMDKQTTTTKVALLAASPSQNTKTPLNLPTQADASIIRGSATCNSPYQTKQVEAAAVQPQGCPITERGRDSRLSAHPAENQQRSAAERPRRMAIAEQEFDQLRLGSLTQAPESSNTTKTVLENLHRQPEFKQNFEQLQLLKDPTQDSGNGSPAPTPYYKADKVFKWKVLERPGYELSPEVSSAAGGIQVRKVRGRQQDPQQPEVPGVHQTEAAQHAAAHQRPVKAQGRPAQHQEAVIIPDYSDGDVKMEDAGQSTAQPGTCLDPSTVRRLQDSGLLGRSRRR